MASTWLAGATPLVGRRHELDALIARLDAAARGETGVVLLAGEPGMGKTRLAEEFATAAQGRGTRVLWGRCYEGEGAPAFWPWIQVIRSYLHDRDPQTLAAELGTAAACIAQIVPAVAERLPDMPPPPTLPPEQARFRQFDSIATFLSSAARIRPLVLILDDLHWADAPSLQLLQFLSQELRVTSLLVLGTYRHIEVDRQHPLSRTLAALARTAISERLTLGGLSCDDVARFIAGATGSAPPPELAAAICDQTEGNPLFVAEIVRLLVEREEEREGSSLFPLPSSLPPVPQTVRAVIGRRLERLSETCHRVLTVAALIGRRFSLRELERVTELAGQPLLEALEEAESAYVITAVPGALGRYRFSHALIRETLEADMPTLRRVRLHRQVGEALEQLWQPNLDAHLAALAHHFFQAAAAGDAAPAIAYSRRAGDHALAQLAYEESAGHYQRALQALDLWTPADVTQRCELLLALGDAWSRAGETAGAQRTFLQAATAARSLRHAEMLAGAAVGYGAAGVVPGIIDTTLTALLDEALRALPAGAGPLRARVLARLAMELYWTDDVARRDALSHEAVAIARASGDRATLAHTLNARHFATWTPDRAEERLATATEIVRLGELLGEPELLLRGHNLRIVDLLELGDIAGLDVAIAAHSRIAEELRQPLHLWHSVLRQAMRALLDGRFAEGERLAREALALGQVKEADAAQAFGIQMFSLLSQQGRLDELGTAVAQLVERFPMHPGYRAMRAWHAARTGDRDTARRELERAAERDFAGLPWNILWLSTATLLAEVCTILGDAPRAATLYGLLRPHATRWTAVGYASSCAGPVSRPLGILAALAQATPDPTTAERWRTAARDHFEHALTVSSAASARPWLARTALDYATFVKETGKRGQGIGRGAEERAAGELAGMALGIARTIGMHSVVSEAEALLASLTQPAAPAHPVPLPATPGPLTAPSLPDDLSEREAEVLRLLAGGQTSREIADELVVSVRTVERHVLNIYRKIGARRRADATAYAVRHHLL